MNEKLSSRQKRILIVSPMFYGPPWREGVTNLARRLSDFLIQKEHKVIVMSPKGTREDRRFSVGEVGETVMYVNSGGSISRRERLNFWSKTLFKLMLLRERVDVVFIFASTSISYAIRTILIKYISRSRTLVYLTASENHIDSSRRLITADRLVVISAYFLKWFPDAVVVYPFLPVDLAHASPKGGSEDKKVFHFLFLGALEKERGIETMLQAFASALRKSKRPLFLTLAWNGYGDYTLHYIQSLLSRLGIRKHVQIDGIVDRAQAYSRCDAVLIPHISETRMAFPVRILESLHMRRPLIVTDACGMGNLIKGCGLAVKRGNAEEMAKAMVRLANDYDLYQECVRKCEPLLEEYDSDRSLQTLYDCIEEVAK